MTVTSSPELTAVIALPLPKVKVTHSVRCIVGPAWSERTGVGVWVKIDARQRYDRYLWLSMIGQQDERWSDSRFSRRLDFYCTISFLATSGSSSLRFCRHNELIQITYSFPTDFSRRTRFLASFITLCYQIQWNFILRKVDKPTSSLLLLVWVMDATSDDSISII